ncbi:MULTISPECIES: gluconokinase [unclassified Leifsonia]|uniref:gluconokinase n=1 Tax=unclassified Leifsonia TaxID=2663824 RepID=UPI0008A7DDA2|nr:MULTISPECIES: gluconokinase [unclassified Leifsonia]SEH66152.1 gluconate kinase, SKI family [Leifsonia sp. CL154]SFL27903.1 gluconate kinase, SKI family [Leifsonia sp. CL147]
MTAPLIVLMGVSGSGKSTIGAAFAQRLGVHFIDGDDLHSAANIAKMTAGIPLEDADRWPWLADIGRTLSDHSTSGLVIACSALKRTYRDVIRWEAPTTVFVHAHGEAELIHSRMAARPGHYMPVALLHSQLAILEPLAEDENGLVLDIQLPVDELVESVQLTLATQEGLSWATTEESNR